jgi:peptidoglycan biosynthesis protein MviN/MurJ (putative lipid II flippase)
LPIYGHDRICGENSGRFTADDNSVPLIISTITTVLQIFLELALISTVRVRSAAYQPTVVTQAIIRLVCEYVLFYCTYSSAWRRHAYSPSCGVLQTSIQVSCTDETASPGV